MPLTDGQHLQVQAFFNQSEFEKRGGVITDLDGTAIHEYEGRYVIPQSVESGLIKIYELGRPVVINTLRFPLSVIRTFGKEWYKLSNAPIPTVLMNGSQLGLIHLDGDVFDYEELEAYPLQPAEIEETFSYIKRLVNDGISDLLVFYYPRDWKQGEIIWTPVNGKTGAVEKKYLSASKVYSCSLEELKTNLCAQQICMVFLLIEIPQDKLMAYQHTARNNFFTRKGVDKRSGTEHIARLLQFDLRHSIGAGDSEMDTFLNSVGLAIHVGNPYLTYEGVMPPLKINNSSEFGELLFELAALQRNVLH